MTFILFEIFGGGLITNMYHNRDEKHHYNTKSNNSVGPNNRVGGKKGIQN